jgi:hypothetical protein
VAPHTIEQPSTPATAPAEGSRSPRRRLPAGLRAHSLLWALAGVAVFSVALVVWARTRPGFDPYGWLVWGHQTVVGSLDTNAAPSWKPLPYLFTVPYALAGHYQLWLWMFTSVAVSLSGVLFAARIAYRLTAAPADRRYAGLIAGAFAGLALLGIQDYSHYVLSAQSDPMIVALCLAAIDCHLSGRPRWAFVLGALASLGRPEVWPFLGLYSIWTWRTIPSTRRLIVAGVVVLLLLWFGIPALSSRSAFVAGTNALNSGRALHNNKVFGTIGRFLDLHAAVLEIVALASIGWAIWRRDRTTIALAAGALAWVVVEIAFALHGWPGLPRYMFEASAVMVVVAGVLVGRLLAEGLPVVPRAPSWAGIPIVVLIVAALVPSALSRARTEHKDLRIQRTRTHQLNSLTATINRLGGPGRFRSCGEPLTRLEWQTILAWNLRINVVKIGFKYSPAIQSGRPIVLFTPTSKGSWRVQALHQHAPQCRSLPR